MPSRALATIRTPDQTFSRVVAVGHRSSISGQRKCDPHQARRRAASRPSSEPESARGVPAGEQCLDRHLPTVVRSTLKRWLIVTAPVLARWMRQPQLTERRRARHARRLSRRRHCRSERLAFGHSGGHTSAVFRAAALHDGTGGHVQLSGRTGRLPRGCEWHAVDRVIAASSTGTRRDASAPTSVRCKSTPGPPAGPTMAIDLRTSSHP